MRRPWHQLAVQRVRRGMPDMRKRRIVLHAKTRAKLERDAKRCRDADTRIRYRIVLLSDLG